MMKAVVFVDSTDMKITLPPEQAEMLSSKETIREIIKKNPDTVMAYDIYDEGELIVRMLACPGLWKNMTCYYRKPELMWTTRKAPE